MDVIHKKNTVGNNFNGNKIYYHHKTIITIKLRPGHHCKRCGSKDGEKGDELSQELE